MTHQAGDPFPMWQSGPFIAPTPSSRVLPVNIPFSNFGITIVTLDGHGNLTIKVDQPHPSEPVS